MKEITKTKQLTPLQWLGLALSLLALVLVFWGLRDQDRYDRLDEEPGYVLPYDPKEAPELQAGSLFAEGFEMTALYPGQYELTVRYDCLDEGSWFEVMDIDDQKLLARGEYTPEGQTTVRFTVDHRLRSVKVFSYLDGQRVFIESYEARTAKPVYTDTYWAALLLAGAVLVFLLCRRQYRQGNAYPLLLLAAVLLCSLPFMTEHLPCGHDLDFHLSRIDGMATALLSGQFPVRNNPDFMLGAGYINPIMYPEGFLYLPAVMCAGGASVLFAYKAFCILIQLATAFVGYGSMKQLLGKKGGFWFALFFLLNPYRLNDLFVRAALGEVLAMTFLPLAAVGLWQLFQGDFRRGFVLAVAGVTAVFQSHLISTMLLIFFGGLYGLYCMAVEHKKFFGDLRRLLTLAAAAVTTLLLNLWFIVPFLYYSTWDLNVFLDKPDLSRSGVYLWQAFMESFALDGERRDTATVGEMPLSVGLALLLAVLVLLFILLEKGRRSERDRQLLGVGSVALGMGSAALLMASNLFPWQKLQQISLVNTLAGTMQFSWRMLIAVSFLFSIAAAVAAVYLTEHRQARILAVLVVFLISGAAGTGANYLAGTPTGMRYKSDDWEQNKTDSAQYIRVQDDAATLYGRIYAGHVLPQGFVKITDFTRYGTGMTIDFENPTGQINVMELPLYNYELHRAYLEDGTPLPVTSGENNLVNITVPEGVTGGRIHVVFAERRLFRLAEGVSALTLAGLLGLSLWKRSRRPEHQDAAPALAAD